MVKHSELVARKGFEWAPGKGEADSSSPAARRAPATRMPFASIHDTPNVPSTTGVTYSELAARRRFASVLGKRKADSPLPTARRAPASRSPVASVHGTPSMPGAAENVTHFELVARMRFESVVGKRNADCSPSAARRAPAIRSSLASVHYTPSMLSTTNAMMDSELGTRTGLSSALGKRKADWLPPAAPRAPPMCNPFATMSYTPSMLSAAHMMTRAELHARRRFASVLGKRKADSPPPTARGAPAKVRRSETDGTRRSASPTQNTAPPAPRHTRPPRMPPWSASAARSRAPQRVQEPTPQQQQPPQHNGRAPAPAPARAMQSARNAHRNTRSITSTRSRQTSSQPQHPPATAAPRAAMPDSTPPPSTPTPPSTPPPLPHPPGLLNLGNTCYINSVLQVLYNQPLFRTALAHWSGPPSSDFSCELAQALQSLFRTLDHTQLLQRESSRPTALPTADDDECDTLDTDPLDDLRENVDYVSPSAFVSLLRDERCDFEAVGQQDAHEFLRFLLDKVDAALKMHPSAFDYHRTDAPQSPLEERSAAQQLGRLRGGEAAKHDSQDVPSSSVAAPIKVKGTELPRLAKRRRVSEASDASEPSSPAEHLRPRKRFRPTLVPDLFEGKAVTATRCDFCESMSNRAEQFLDVSLPVEAGRNLNWAWSKTGAKEKLVGVNKYSCDTCNTYTEAQRWWRVVTLPKVLTVHLKLFAFDSPYTSSGEKVAVAMPCPFEMRLSEWCTEDCEQRDMLYRLSAVIVHEGNGASSGHYYSYIYRDDKAEWYVFDDSLVSIVSKRELQEKLFTSARSRRTAYLLFYTQSPVSEETGTCRSPPNSSS